MPPAVSWVSASIPKRGNAPAENEDATAILPARLRFAAADGATEGWQSRGWARHLATAFARRPPEPDGFADWLAAVRESWQPPAPPESVAWYAEAKRAEGSFATLVGVELRERTAGPGYAWKAVAVGDSCLLVLRRDRFEVAFPLASAAEFGTRPALVPSSPDRPAPDPEWLAGRAEPGDLFLLATDAVARYLLALADPAGDALVAAARESAASGHADALIQSLLRLQDTLNDDASVVAVRLPDAPESPR